MVRKSGPSSAKIIMKSARSAHALAIRREEYPARIAIEQQRRHHARIEWRLAKRARVGALDFTQVQALPDQRHDETRQMVLRHEVLHARRQKLHLVDLPEAEMLAHGARQNQTRSENATDYSDRLLVLGRGSSGHRRSSGQG